MQTSNVVQFVPKAAQQEANEWASGVVANALSLELELDTQALTGILKGVTKVAYFSGDIEDGSSRNAKIVDKSQIVRAASSQLFTYEVFDQHIRVVFDADYIYDLYLDSFHTTNNILTLIKQMLECSQEVRRAQFDNYVNSLFGAAAL